MLIDFHSHIPPGIDDGSPNAKISDKMLLMEKEHGIGKIALTPHFYLYEQSVGRFLEKLKVHV